MIWIAIRENELSNSRERITNPCKRITNPWERITNPWERAFIVQVAGNLIKISCQMYNTAMNVHYESPEVQKPWRDMGILKKAISKSLYRIVQSVLID